MDTFGSDVLIMPSFEYYFNEVRYKGITKGSEESVIRNLNRESIK